MNFIKEQYQLSFHFLKKHYLLFISMLLLFVLVIILCYIAFQDSSALYDLLSKITEMFASKDLIDVQGNISALGLIRSNILACSLSILLGLLPFLFLPLLALFANAFIIGIMVAALSMLNLTLTSFVAGLLPHGIFEIPAMILSFTLGIYLCKELTMNLLQKRKNTSIQPVFENVLRVYVTIIIPFLIIAGFIEAYLTPIIMNCFL